jgi:N-acetylneuraminate synthase
MTNRGPFKYPSQSFKIGKATIGPHNPTYFIADIGANHDGDLARARDLIFQCADAGADAAKFQHFAAATIVSDHGFRNLPAERMSHQASWKKSVFEVYQSASIDPDWTEKLVEYCVEAGIEFMTSPYSREMVDAVDPYVRAYKIGSGDITWSDHIEYIASKGKPVLLACGASTQDEIVRAVQAVLKQTPDVSILQCNTNYTASLENFDYINLNVLKTFREMYPSAVLGLSDHTPGHATTLGAVALEGRIIEKHFTDSNDREGPDHKFAMNPQSWRDMVDRTRELERALGQGIKRIEQNEKDTVVVQRRCIRTDREVPAGAVLSEEDLICLRPCPEDAIPPYEINRILGRAVTRDLSKGEYFRWSDLQS